jgi:hypothetical protein
LGQLLLVTHTPKEKAAMPLFKGKTPAMLHKNRSENCDFSYSIKWKKTLFRHGNFSKSFSFGVGI